MAQPRRAESGCEFCRLFRRSDDVQLEDADPTKIRR